MAEDRCICCGAVIPEGMMVCPNCSVSVKPRTNAERIRAMSDEVLAWMFSEFCRGMENCNHCICYDNCPGESADCWMKWLKQPVEEELWQ